MVELNNAEIKKPVLLESELEKKLKSENINPIDILKKINELSTRVTELYFAPKSFEKDGKIYEALGVRVARYVILKPLDLLMGRFSPYRVPFWRNPRSQRTINKLDMVNKYSEMIHLLLLSQCVLTIISGVTHERYDVAAAGLGFGVANAYLAMLQRYVRPAIYELKQRIKDRSVHSLKT
ncbi:TPA: hypothetical protein HA246_05335 [Candidatus Woesearchaeota archaeon]|nr:hypothetical protein [Candidatus Woesearchaeota archaeon]